MNEILKQFDSNFFDKDKDEIIKLSKALYNSLILNSHCDILKKQYVLECVFDEEDYLYKFENDVIKLNLSMCKNFNRLGYLFVIDALATVVRIQMQNGLVEFLREKENNGGKFWDVQSVKTLSSDFQKLFDLNSTLLLYATVEKDKSDWFSVTQFDRRSFAGRFMFTFFQTFVREECNDYMSYLCECFFKPDENSVPLNAEKLQELVVAKFKKENRLEDLEEDELSNLILYTAKMFEN